MKRPALLALSLALVACGGPETDAPTQPTRTPAPQRTAAPTAVNYVALRGTLLPPLQSLIVAVRNNDAGNAARFLTDFNTAADRVLPVIERDVSTNGNRLHSVIVNTREAAARKDVATLERQRLTLLEVR